LDLGILCSAHIDLILTKVSSALLHAWHAAFHAMALSGDIETCENIVANVYISWFSKASVELHENSGTLYPFAN
jgi:hypothetical protein